MNEQLYRSFIAFELPEAATKRCIQLKHKLSKGGMACKWTTNNNFHITINFMGNKELAELKEINERIKALNINNKDIKLKFSEINTFGKPPKILYIGLEDHKNKSANTAKKIMETCSLSNQHRWIPHLTLGRFRNLSESKTWYKFKSLQVSGCTFSPTAITVFLSKLTQSGPTYTRLDEL